jgi:hypothetical protein
VGAIRRFCRVVIQHGGRLFVIVVGAGVLLWALLGDRQSNERIAALIVGGFLIMGAALLPWIEELRGGPMSLRPRPSDPGTTAREVEQARQEQPEPEAFDLTGDDDSWIGAQYRLGERALDQLLTNLDGKLHDCEARVFLYDADVGKLLPLWRPESASGEPLGWEPGQGVTGVAYKEKRYEFAKWPRTQDPEYRLTAEMKARYADLKVVAALPLHNQRDEVIGTLSLASTSIASRMVMDEGYQQHLALAEQVAVILVELMHVA